MSNSNDIFVSNGTCYSAAGKELDKSFIPCGNDAFGHQTCCGAGDNCLADNACWGIHGSGYGSSLTYMAGCTDPDYRDASCPDKKSIDQAWIALTLCDDSDGAWAPCSQVGNPTTLQPGSYCTCTDAASTTVAVKDTNTLSSLASLPQRTGESILFFPGHTPTSLPVHPETSSPGSPQGSTGSGNNVGTATQTNPHSPSPTGPGQGPTSSLASHTSSPAASQSGSASLFPSPAPEPSSSSLSSAAKAGLIGGLVGLFLLLLTIAALLLLRRHRQQSLRGRSGNTKHKPRYSDTSSMPTVPESDGHAISEADGKVARPWSMRSELEGKEIGRGSNSEERPGVPDAESRVNGHAGLSPVAELPGSEYFFGPRTGTKNE
ncbi:hypothetical protein B0H67DRAFT_604567 [Lasiosphaeris hirsuta]|uniref:Uncharacterized protein n=1 Tax=Lasiosphaeris hirsuta TaxID=260670 RepID=A0AA39ZRP6_9PEZI|nr:hypothetical protein B0H67DRAFT_604567 [Lasiosphaeris hirsuta]